MKAAVLFLLVASTTLVAQTAEPTLNEVMSRVGAYVAGYGEKVAVIVATEKYSQFIGTSGEMGRPREIEAEFAIVRVPGGWTGYRDVIRVDGESISDRQGRLVALLTDTSGDASEVTRIANESARFNVGPITRNINTPTVAMFFFTPADQPRFLFTRKGRKNIDGVDAWEIEFKETRLPTLIRTRSGRNVPVEGTLWVRPGDGLILQTLLKMRNFFDQERTVIADAPVQRPDDNPASNNGGREALDRNVPVPNLNTSTLRSEASIRVTYQKPANLDHWFPAEMDEFYSGPIFVNSRAVMASARTHAKYSNFRQFGVSIKIVQ